MTKRIKYLADSVNRLTMVPAEVSRTINSSAFTNNNSTATPIDIDRMIEGNLASLSRNSKSLYTLWHKYEYEIGSRKPAKCFTSRDRGSIRYNFSKRKVFWDLVVLMANRCREASESIDMIYKHYGYKVSVTFILMRLQRERKMGSDHSQFF